MSIAQTETGVISSSNTLLDACSSQTNTVTEVLTLRLVPRRRKKAVRWAEDVVDNELLGKKKSKKCCIFHKQQVFGNWSDDEDAASDGECETCQEES